MDELLASLAPESRLLHLCGEDRRAPHLPEQQISCVAVYRARAMEVPDGLHGLRDQVAAVHSPRAAKRLAELVPEGDRANIRIAAISQAAGDAAGPGWAAVGIAAVPTDSALLALAVRLCET